MTDRALFIGHSLVGPVMPTIFDTFMADQGLAMRADAQIINGSPLRYNWDNGASAEGVDARAVLPSGNYGVVVVTEAIPLDDQIQWNDSQGYAKRYFDLAHSINADTQFYLYETWHEIGSDVQAWRNQITSDAPKWQGIIDYVNDTAPANAPEALVIPAGQAMGNLHDAIVAGNVPGLSSIRDLFSDDIHLNDLGAWFIAAVHAEAVADVDVSALPLQTTSVWGNIIAGPDAGTAQVMAQVIEQTLSDVGMDSGTSNLRQVEDTPAPIAPIDVVVDPPQPIEPPQQDVALQLTGDANSNVLTGDAGADLIQGFGGNDILIGGLGNDQLDGGQGWDTARFTGTQQNYTLTLSAGEVEISDRRADGTGTDSLSGIEDLEFMDPADIGQVSRVDLTQITGTGRLDQGQIESIVELYIAFFNRAPDAIGLNFWGTAFADGLTLEQIATLFIAQDEVQQLYPTWMSVEDFATSVYANVLGRTADGPGYDFWTTALSSGAVGRDQFILSVLQGAKAPPAAGMSDSFVAQQLADQQYLANKTDIGAYFSVHIGMTDVAHAQATMAAFDGTAAGFDRAIDQADGFHMAAISPGGAAFLMPLVGVLTDPTW